MIPWLKDRDKFSFMGLELKLDGHEFQSTQLSSSQAIVVDPLMKLPEHWREWIGRIRAEQVEGFNLLLASHSPSGEPEVLNHDDAALQQHAWNLYAGLLLSVRCSTSHPPAMLTGYRAAGEDNIRQQKDFDTPMGTMFAPYPSVSWAHIQRAASLGRNLGQLNADSIPGGRWRLNRTLHLYHEARTTTDLMESLHQYCRVIDGLILPAPGAGKSHFRSRTELFIGPQHHELMGQIYDLRSASEHLHENLYLESFDREVRLDLLKKEAIIEWIAREALARVIETPSLWPHFANTGALAKFWRLPPSERQALWGNRFNPADAHQDFDPKYIHNGMLGKP
jgi:hypothetical protein